MKHSAIIAVSLLAWSPSVATAQTIDPMDPERDYTLPDPLFTLGGDTVETVEQWPERRAEILELFRANVYGRVTGATPEVSFTEVNTDPAAMGGAATLKQVTITITNGNDSLDIDVTLFVPNDVAKPAPAFVLINNRGAENIDPTRAMKSEFWPAEEVIARGYAIAGFQNADVDPDSNDGFQNGIHGLLETGGARPEDAWGSIAAWSWGASRVLDYFETDADIDASKVAVLGHSRGGKAALWAGAEDTRFAITISNDSGCTGAAIARRLHGETVQRINDSFPHWFNEKYKSYNNAEDTLPLDQHMLMALIAPRAVYAASAQDDDWADPRGEYLSLHFAAPVYALWGYEGLPFEMAELETPVHAGRMGYHIRAGEHNLLLSDWERYMDFADYIYAMEPPPEDGMGGAGGAGGAEPTGGAGGDQVAAGGTANDPLMDPSNMDPSLGGDGTGVDSTPDASSGDTGGCACAMEKNGASALGLLALLPLAGAIARRRRLSASR